MKNKNIRRFLMVFAIGILSPVIVITFIPYLLFSFLEWIVNDKTLKESIARNVLLYLEVDIKNGCTK